MGEGGAESFGQLAGAGAGYGTWGLHRGKRERKFGLLRGWLIGLGKVHTAEMARRALLVRYGGLRGMNRLLLPPAVFEEVSWTFDC